MLKSYLAAGTILTTALLPVGSVYAQSDTKPSADVSGLENIVVTARRREESAQTTPVSVVALTAATLERKNILQPAQLGASVAGLVSLPQGSFNGGSTTFIRGIGATDSLLTIDQPIAQYRDGVYMGHTTTSGNIDMSTLDRLEVLRGPQGTLFGRNTTGGALNYVTRDPKDDFHASERLRYGTYNEFLSGTTLDTGLIGSSGIKALLTYQHHQRFGDIDDPSAGGNRDPGAYKTDSFFAKIKGEWGNFSLVNAFDWYENKGVPEAFQLTSDRGAFAAYTANSPSYGGAPLDISPNRLGTLHQAAQNLQVNKNYGEALTAQYVVSPALTLKSISAWRYYRGPDLSFTFGNPNMRGILTTSGGAPVNYTVAYVAPKYGAQDAFSQEVQALGTVGEFSYQVGGFYFNETGVDSNTGAFLFALSPTLALISQSTTTYFVDNTSKAGYGELTYKPHWMDDKFELTGGIRRSSDHKTVNTTVGVVRTGDKTFNNTTWSTSAKYQWTPEVMTFVRIGTGIRAGGFNTRASANQNFIFEPEHATSYEAGIKSQLLDNRVRFNADVYYTKYRDLQVTTINGAGAATGGISGATYNANATFRGGEVELTVVPTEGLTVGGNLGYVDPKYSQIFFPDPATGVPTNYANISKFPYVAKLNANLDVTYEMPISIGTLIANINYSYLSKRWFGINTLSSQQPLNDTIASPAHFLINGRITVADIGVGNTKAEIALWCDNMTNKFYRVMGIDYGALQWGGNTYNVPRTVGVDVKVEY